MPRQTQPARHRHFDDRCNGSTLSPTLLAPRSPSVPPLHSLFAVACLEQVQVGVPLVPNHLQQRRRTTSHHGSAEPAAAASQPGQSSPSRK